MRAVLWRRNVVAAIVLALALAVVVVTRLGPQWNGYRDTIVPPVIVDRGESATLDGHRWQLGAVTHLDGPGDATGFVVSVQRAGEGALPPCRGVLTDGKRRWAAVPGPALDAGATAVCDLPGPLQLRFEIPGSTVPTALDITEPDGQILLRLRL